jgi:non-canonical purine NTP pyrophosphatase (RdgB/HAM1 family)
LRLGVIQGGREIAFVTGNRHKLIEAQRILAAAMADEPAVAPARGPAGAGESGGGEGVLEPEPLPERVATDRGAMAVPRLLPVELDLPEIQELDLHEVLRAKAEEAWRRLGRPLVVEDTALELAALGGFPGPLVKWLLQAVGAEGIARLGLVLGNPGVVARCGLLYRDAERELAVEGVTRGTLVLPGRGPRGFGWDPVFLPDGERHTYGELEDAEKDRIGHRGRAWRALLTALAGA